MKSHKSKCGECEREAYTGVALSMSGPPAESTVPMCQVHYAEYLFDQPDVDGVVGVGDGLFFIPVHLMADTTDEMMFEVAVNIPPNSRIGQELPEGYFEDLEYIEDELFEEVTGVNYDGDDPVGYVIVDVNAEDEHFQTWGVFAEHSVTGEATPL